MPIITAVQNLGSGNYRFTFTESVTCINNTATEGNFLIWNPGLQEIDFIIWDNLGAGTTQNAHALNGSDGCTQAVICDQPDNLTHTDPFEVASPILTIT